jgi:hypothetical protein
MEANYPTDMKNTPDDFSDNFHNIEKFVQVDHSEKNHEKPPHFFCSPLSKKRRRAENIPDYQN